MNTATIYAKAAGREVDKTPDHDKVFARDLLQQEREDWLRNPFTVDLIKFLSGRAAELKNNAALGADAGRDSELIKRMLIKSRAIEEVKDYAISGSKPTE